MLKKWLGVLLGVLILTGTAKGSIISTSGILSGANENPVTGSPGTGTAFVSFDTLTNLLTISVTFAGLTTPDTAAHIHCCIAPPGNAGVATTVPAFPGFPLGVTSGTYNASLDLTSASSYNPAFITANGGTVALAESTLTSGLANNQTYLNIHTGAFPGGEIRGFLTAIPEPFSTTLVGAGLLVLPLLRRRLLRH